MTELRMFPRTYLVEVLLVETMVVVGRALDSFNLLPLGIDLGLESLDIVVAISKRDGVKLVAKSR